MTHLYECFILKNCQIFFMTSALDSQLRLVYY